MKKLLGEYLIDTHFPGMPLLQAGEMEMKAAANPLGFDARDNRSAMISMERFIATHAAQDKELDTYAARSLAGPGFRNRHSFDSGR